MLFEFHVRVLARAACLCRGRVCSQMLRVYYLMYSHVGGAHTHATPSVASDTTTRRKTQVPRACHGSRACDGRARNSRSHAPPPLRQPLRYKLQSDRILYICLNKSTSHKYNVCTPQVLKGGMEGGREPHTQLP